MSTSPQVLPPSVLTLPPYAATSHSRLQALYSDISRQKQSNPTSYQSNVEWWRNALTFIVNSGLQSNSDSRLVLKSDQRLLEQLRIEQVGKPLALSSVVTELESRKSFIPRHDFLTSKESIYNSEWLPRRIAAFVVGKPLWWALEQLGVVGEGGILAGASLGGQSHKNASWWGEYVVVSLVEKAADQVLKKQEKKFGGVGDRLYSFESFREEFTSALGVESVLTEGDAMVLLKYLERDRKVIIFDKDIIKFVTDNASTKEINAVDCGILELIGGVRKLHRQVDGLQKKIDECTQKASVALREKRKALALNYLRSRKQFEDLLSKRLGSLDTLESTLIQVEAAAGDIEIMKSYASSTATLRTLLAHPYLDRGSIDATMDALAEANADAREIDGAVRTGGDIALGVGDEVDESELESELRGLVEQVRIDGDKETTEKLEKIGTAVPNTIPPMEKTRVATF